MIVVALFAGLAVARDLPPLAVVPLDATPGTRYADLERTVRGIVAAVQSEGGVVPLYDLELAARLGETSEERLKTARASLAEGRRMLNEGDADIALAFLEEAVQAHKDSGSDVVRRPELADAYYTLARARLATYDNDGARSDVRRAIQLIPDYMDTRADAVNPEILALAADAAATLADRPPRKLSPDGADALSTQLGVECIAHGSVAANGALSLTVQHGREVRFVVERPGPFLPPSVGDKWYTGIAQQMVAACLGEPVPLWEPPRVATIVPPPEQTPPPVAKVVDPKAKEELNESELRRKRRTAWAASLLSLGVLGVGGAATAYLMMPETGGGATPTWTVVVEAP